MSIEAEIYERAKAHSGLGALVGDRIRPYALPQGETWPAVTYHQVSGRNPARASGTDGTLRADRFQLDGWSYEANEAQQIKDALAAAFTRWSADGTNAGTVVQDTMVENRQVLSEDLEGRRVYHAMVDIVVWHTG